MRGGGLHLHVTLCWRGLRTTHTHRPLTTYFLRAKIRTYSEICNIFSHYYSISKIFRNFAASIVDVL